PVSAPRRSSLDSGGHFVMALLLYCDFILSARGANAFDLGNLGDRHIPPRFVTRHSRFLIDFDYYRSGAVLALHGRYRGFEFLARSRSDGLRAVAFAKLYEIDRHMPAVQLAGAGPFFIIGAEPPRPNSMRQPADAREAMIVEHEDVELDSLLDGGCNLGRHHEERPVTHHDPDFARRIG